MDRAREGVPPAVWSPAACGNQERISDPTDVDDSPLNLGFSELNYDENPVTPKGPDEGTPSTAP
jgi:hypothetical protein